MAGRHPELIWTSWPEFTGTPQQPGPSVPGGEWFDWRCPHTDTAHVYLAGGAKPHPGEQTKGLVLTL